MQLSLNPEIQKYINDRVSSGQYASPEDVVTAAISALEKSEQHPMEFAPGELNELLVEGEQSLKEEGAMDIEEAFRMMREEHARRRKPAP